MLEAPREEGSEEGEERRGECKGERMKEERKRRRKKDEKRRRRGERASREGARSRGRERARGHSVIQPGQAKPVKMFADVSWEKASFYRSPDGSTVIDRPAGLMNGRSSDGAVARRTVKPIVGLF